MLQYKSYTTKCLIQFMALFISIVQFVIPVHADNTNGQGSIGNVGNLVSDGIQVNDGGYRIYFEGPGGTVEGSVIDLYMVDAPPSGNIKRYYSTQIGGRETDAKVFYSDVANMIPGLQTPLLSSNMVLHNWLEQSNGFESQMSNAEMLMKSTLEATGMSKSETSDLLERYQLGELRIVVEAIYWFGYAGDYKMETRRIETPTQIPDPNDPDKMIPQVDISYVDERVYLGGFVSYPYDGARLYVYGTAKEIASFERSELATDPDAVIELGMDKVNQYCQYGTDFAYNYSNANFGTAIQLEETDGDGFSGMGQIPSPTGYYNGSPLYSYNQITAPYAGFGMHIVNKEQASEKWATWDASAYGGPVGKSPGVTPKMPPLAGMENVTTTWRDVTVIKYYEEYSTDKETGKTRSS